MHDRPKPSDAGEQRFNDVLGAYLEAADAGWAPSPEALLRRYPDLADELQAFFSAQSRVACMAFPCYASHPSSVVGAKKGARSGPAADNPPAGGDSATNEAGGDYESLTLIKQGGMGAVYKAWQKGAERWVALKRIKSGRFASRVEVRRFLDEARAAANLEHPNIVKIYQVGESDGEPFFSMKLFERGTLHDRLPRFPKQPRAAAQLLTKVAGAVHYAHQRGILHRDLKPANILLDERDEPHVADFGLAKRLRPEPALDDDGPTASEPAGNSTRRPGPAGTPVAGRQPEDPEPAATIDLGARSRPPTAVTETIFSGTARPAGGTVLEEKPDRPDATRIGAFVGTGSYAAPEHAGIAAGSSSTAADVYSLGAILYRMLTGRTLFDAAGNFVDLIRQIKETPPEPPRRLNPLVDVRLESICLKCLRKDPRERYGSAEALAEDLERWLKGEPPLAWPMPWPRRVWRASRRYAAVALLATLAGFATSALFFVYYYFDPERIPRTLAEEARWRPVVLIGDTGPPRWSRWSIGEGTAMVSPEKDRPFSFTTLESARLELLRAAPGPRYRISAEIRHDRVLGNIGWVGLYFGHSQESTEEGPIHHWWDLTFADFGDQARPRKNKKAGAVHGQLALLPRRRHGRPDELNIRLTDVRKTFATAEETGSSPIWRRLAVQVTPEKIQFSWDQQIFREITPAALGKFGEAWEAGDQPEIKFDPHGPFGLVVYKGKASFRNIIVEPVD